MRGKVFFDKLKLIFVFTILGFICMAIASKNSFLYSFNESMDVNIFAVTVREMLRGNVLYKDVYDHKGPILYFLYYAGMLFNNHSLFGVYVLESIFYTLFILNMYRIAGIYTKNEYVKLSVAIIGAVLGCCSVSFFGGGQCEEFALPIITGIMCEILDYFHNTFPNKLNGKKMFFVGAQAAIIFWMKYSLLGIVVGIGLAFVVCNIAAKKIKELFVSGCHFVAGFVGMSVLPLLYFVITSSMSDLWQVYFYDNIFKYSNIDYDAKVSIAYLMFSERSFSIWYIPVLAALITVAGTLLAKDILKKEERLALICMVVFSCIGIVSAHVWTYSPEILCVFVITALLSIFYIFRQYGRVLCLFLCKVYTHIKQYLSEENPNNCVPIVIGCISAICVQQHAVFVLFASMIGLVLLRMLVRVLNRYWALFVVRYALILLGVVYFDYEVLHQVVVMLGLVMVVYDLGLVYQYIKPRIHLPGQIRPIEKIACVVLIAIFVVELVVNGLLMLVVYSDDRNKSIEEYPQYQMAQYIRTYGNDDSTIINYDCLDNGVYYLLDQYPPEGRFASNNASADEINDMANRWIVTQQADFVVASYFTYRERIDLERYGYKKVYSETCDYLYSGQEYTYCLYQRQ